MRLLRHVLQRLRAAARRRRFERDLDDEMRFHLEMQAAAHATRGLSPAEARVRAEREFGGAARYKDEVRDARGLTALDDARRDVRFAVRSLLRARGYAAVAVGTLAL